MVTDKKAEIMRCGKELFRTRGFKDTNVADIMKMANLGTGTFYNYFSSKDKLFMDIFIEENVKLKKSIMESVDLEGEPLDVMMKLIYLNNQGMSTNPILREWYNRDVFNKIEKVYREEKGVQNVDFLYDCFIEVIRRWQNNGKLRKDIDAEMIMGIFAALINADTHKEEIGLQYFPDIMEYLGVFIMKGLMERTEK